MKVCFILLPPARPENVPLGAAPFPPALIFHAAPKSTLGTALGGSQPHTPLLRWDTGALGAPSGVGVLGAPT